MPKLKRLEVEPPVYLLNDGLFFAIDQAISEAPVYFRQKDAEAYFDNPYLLGDKITSSLKWAVQYRWFSPRYRPMRFDFRQMKPYTNEELLHIFGYTYDDLLVEAKYWDDLDFRWEQNPFPTPSKSAEELDLEYLKARSDYAKSCQPTEK